VTPAARREYVRALRPRYTLAPRQRPSGARGVASCADKTVATGRNRDGQEECVRGVKKSARRRFAPTGAVGMPELVGRH
jgi:hypothetical protein